MLLAGDELRRTQTGNNNAYCQDNELSWLDWDLDERARGILDFARRLLRLRAEHPVFRRSEFLTGEERQGSGAPDVWWFRPDGRRMTQADWARGDAFALGAFLNGAEIPSRTADGEPIGDESFIVLFNAWREPVSFVLPPARFGRRWTHELCTAEPDVQPNGETHSARATVPLPGRSLKVLRRVG
jgi:glycogen operon protein